MGNAETSYLCPQCRKSLAAVREGELDTWQCEAGHGVAITLTESIGRLQDDEVDAIWKAARSAPLTDLQSPLLGRPMARITVTVDDDEIVGNEGPGAHPVTLDVAPEEQFLWFSVGDFAAMPHDLPNPPPTAAEKAAGEALARQSREAVAKDLASKDSGMDDLAYRIGSKAAAVLHLGGLVRKLRG